MGPRLTCVIVALAAVAVAAPDTTAKGRLEAAPLCETDALPLVESIDLDRDGTAERVSIRVRSGRGPGSVRFAVEQRGPAGGYTTATSYATRFIGSRRGLSAGASYPELNGDGRREAVLCLVDFPNDFFLTVVVFAQTAGGWRLVLARDDVAKGEVLLLQSRLAIRELSDWYAGRCRRYTTTFYRWSGARLVVARVQVRREYDRSDC